MKVNLMFPNKYLKADDLDRDYTLTISGVSSDILELNDKKKTKKQAFLISFEETGRNAKKSGSDEKKFVLNKTNAKSIASLYGNDTDNWIGQKITLYATTCDAFGKTVDCVRVRGKK